MGQEWKTLSLVVIGAAIVGWLAVRQLSADLGTGVAEPIAAAAVAARPTERRHPPSPRRRSPHRPSPRGRRTRPPPSCRRRPTATSRYIERDLGVLAQALGKDQRIEDRRHAPGQRRLGRAGRRVPIAAPRISGNPPWAAREERIDEDLGRRMTVACALVGMVAVGARRRRTARAPRAHRAREGAAADRAADPRRPLGDQTHPARSPGVGRHRSRKPSSSTSSSSSASARSRSSTRSTATSSPSTKPISTSSKTLRKRALAIDERLGEARTLLVQANRGDIDELKRSSQRSPATGRGIAERLRARSPDAPATLMSVTRSLARRRSDLRAAVGRDGDPRSLDHDRHDAPPFVSFSSSGTTSGRATTSISLNATPRATSASRWRSQCGQSPLTYKVTCAAIRTAPARRSADGQRA